MIQSIKGQSVDGYNFSKHFPNSRNSPRSTLSASSFSARALSQRRPLEATGTSAGIPAPGDVRTLWWVYTMWGPRSIAKLVNITPITMVYGTYNELLTGAYKPTNITGGGHIVWYVCYFLLWNMVGFWGLGFPSHVSTGSSSLMTFSEESLLGMAFRPAVLRFRGVSSPPFFSLYSYGHLSSYNWV